jgi:hypothetical protein
MAHESRDSTMATFNPRMSPTEMRRIQRARKANGGVLGGCRWGHDARCEHDSNTIVFGGRPWKAPGRKAFSPKVGDVGSWVVFDWTPRYVGGGAEPVTGQVWAKAPAQPNTTWPKANGEHVWVATGTSFFHVKVSALRSAADPVEQPVLV